MYEKDPATNAFIIPTSLEKYSDFFNMLDPSPLRKRDLNRDLRAYLEDCSSDISLKQEIILQFNLRNETIDKMKEEKIRQALKTYFSFATNLLSSEVRKSYEQGVVYAGLSLIFLFISYFLNAAIVGNLLLTTLIAGISIIGWVFLWEAISTFTFRKRGVRTRIGHYNRFVRAQVRFNYDQKIAA